MRAVALFVLALAAAGCATIANDRKETIPVRSQPAGAVVTVACGTAAVYGGVTPAVIILDRAADPCELTVAKEGYAARKVVLERTISRATQGNKVPGIAAAAVAGLFTAFFMMDNPHGDDAVASAVRGGMAVGEGAANAVDRKTGAAYKHVPGEIFVTLDRRP
jgi:hypothetical protein